MTRGMKSLLWVVTAYDSAITLFCLSAGVSVAVDAIWRTPRFHSSTIGIISLQVFIVIAGLISLRVSRRNNATFWSSTTLFLSHSLLALLAIWLLVVCDGAIWKATTP